MILPDFKAFPRTGRILGVDWGAVRTGIAVSDDARAFVFTRPAIVMPRRGDNVAPEIARIAADENVVGIVIGLPLHGDGTESETTIAVRRMATDLCTYTDLPIAFIDENLTSMIAQENLGKMSRNQIKQKLDSAAACVILENAISVIDRM